MEFTPRLEVASNASVPAFAPVVVLQYAGDFSVPFKKLYGSAVRLLHGSSDSRRHREVVRSDDCVFGHGWILAEKGRLCGLRTIEWFRRDSIAVSDLLICIRYHLQLYRNLL